MFDFIEKNKDITQLSNFKTKAKAKYYYEFNNLEQLHELKLIFKYIQDNDVQHLIVWWWTNMLFAFDIYEGIIIKNNLKWWSYNEKNKILESNSAESIWDIAQILETDDHQDLWHRFIWLPGSIGWAVYWNAGCFWLETQNNFIEAFVLNKQTGETEFLSLKDMNFSYRSSILKENNKYFLLKAKFDLSKKIEKYHSDVDNIDFRENKQPAWNTCGSFFKNPSKEFSAWKLIEEVGLKGFVYWWASFSELHANFLMNNGQGDYKDLLYLIDLACKKVKEKFDINLINEVRIITNK